MGARLAANFPFMPSTETVRQFTRKSHCDPLWRYGVSEQSIIYFHQQACSHYGENFDASKPLHAAFSMDATDVEVNQQFNGDDFIGDEDHGNLAGVSGSSHAELQAGFKRLAAAVRDKTSSRSSTVDKAIALETFAASVTVELNSILAAAKKKLIEKRVKYRSTNESKGSSAELFGLQKTYITTYRKRVEICESAIRHLAELLVVAERRKSEGNFSDAEREEMIDTLKQSFLVRRRAATHFFSGVLQAASGRVVVPIVRLAFEQMSQDQVRALRIRRRSRRLRLNKKLNPQTTDPTPQLSLVSLTVCGYKLFIFICALRVFVALYTASSLALRPPHSHRRLPPPLSLPFLSSLISLLPALLPPFLLHGWKLAL